MLRSVVITNFGVGLNELLEAHLGDQDPPSDPHMLDLAQPDQLVENAATRLFQAPRGQATDQSESRQRWTERIEGSMVLHVVQAEEVAVAKVKTGQRTRGTCDDVEPRRAIWTSYG